MARRKASRIPDALLDQLLAGVDPKTAFESNGLIDDLKVSAKGRPRSGSGADMRFFALFGDEGSADGNFCIYAYA